MPRIPFWAEIAILNLFSGLLKEKSLINWERW